MIGGIYSGFQHCWCVFPRPMFSNISRELHKFTKQLVWNFTPKLRAGAATLHYKFIGLWKLSFTGNISSIYNKLLFESKIQYCNAFPSRLTALLNILRMFAETFEFYLEIVDVTFFVRGRVSGCTSEEF